MRTPFAYLGWSIAIIAVGVAAYGWRLNAQLAVQLDDMKQDLERLSSVSSEREAAVVELQKKLSEQQAKSQEAAASEAKAEPGASSILQKMMGALVPGGKEQKASDGKDANPFKGLAQMYSGENGKQMAKMGAEMAVNMQYRDLFTSLNLPSDVEQRLREILSDSMAEQISSGMQAMSGGTSREAMKAAKEKSDADLRSKVAAVLSADEMAKWDEYQAEMPKHVLTQSLDMQLNMLAPSLAAETHNRARDVIVEEMLASQVMPDATGFPESGDFQAQISAQQEAMTRARDRLAQELNESDLAQIDGLISQMQRMMEMSSQMMGNLVPKEEAKPK